MKSERRTGSAQRVQLLELIDDHQRVFSNLLTYGRTSSRVMSMAPVMPGTVLAAAAAKPARNTDDRPSRLTGRRSQGGRALAGPASSARRPLARRTGRDPRPRTAAVRGRGTPTSVEGASTPGPWRANTFSGESKPRSRCAPRSTSSKSRATSAPRASPRGGDEDLIAIGLCSQACGEGNGWPK